MKHPEADVLNYLSDLIDAMDDDQELEWGYAADVRSRASAFLRSLTPLD